VPLVLPWLASQCFPVQQSESAEQFWPDPAHGVHAGNAAVGSVTHFVPLQQSASRVHPIPVHEDPRQVYVPVLSGTHGALRQQFALEAHAPPAPEQTCAEHRATPAWSGLQVSADEQLPLQQSQVPLQLDVASLQRSPSGLQPIGRRHRPTVDGGVIAHVTGNPEPPGSPALPQQSLSSVHASPAA
jgi:hypothetical protein